MYMHLLLLKLLCFFFSLAIQTWSAELNLTVLLPILWCHMLIQFI